MPQILPLEQHMTQTQTTTPSAQKKASPQSSEAAPITAQKVEETKPKEPTSDPRLQVFLKQEQDLLRQKRELSQKQKMLDEQYKPWQEASEIAKQNKLEAIKRLGISYDDLTNEYLNNGQLPPEKIAELKATQIVEERLKQLGEQQKLDAEQSQQKAYQQALTQITADVKYTVTSGDNFPLVKDSEAFEDVTKYIESQFHETGRIIPTQEAIEHVEQEILEGVLALAKHEKIRSKILLEIEDPKRNPEVDNHQLDNQKPQTLTHKTTVAPPSANPETWEQKKARLIQKYWTTA